MAAPLLGLLSIARLGQTENGPPSSFKCGVLLKVRITCLEAFWVHLGISNYIQGPSDNFSIEIMSYENFLMDTSCKIGIFFHNEDGAETDPVALGLKLTWFSR